MKKAILAGIDLESEERDFSSLMDETASLCEACRIEVAGIITQRSMSMDRNTAFRKGKLEELAAMVKELDADLVIFHNPLRIQVSERIAAVCGVNVIDRTALILDIFAQRARSRQAKLQTEMARLQYDLPRVLHSTADESGHERGGSAYNRGAGEMRSEIVRRRYGARISELKKELQRIEDQRYHDERRRTRTLMRRAALVGYTNAGKSSLMNALIGSTVSAGQKVYEEDMLFATLDTSVRMIRTKDRSFLLYDTVGFVSDLPHTLVEAFRSTLDAARDADLLIHVIDASDRNWQQKAEITEDTLRQIGAGEIPVLRVFNKIDLVSDKDSFPGTGISCLTKEGIERLQNTITDRLYPVEKTMICLIPYADAAVVDRYKAALIIELIENTEEGMKVKIAGPLRYVTAFRHYEYEEEES